MTRNPDPPRNPGPPPCVHDWVDLGPLERPDELRYCPRCGASKSLTKS